MDDLVERLLRWEERTYGPFGRQVRVSEETLTEAAARIQALETSLATVQRAAKTIMINEADELRQLRNERVKWHQAIATLDSERQANALLTDRVEALETSLAEAEGTIATLRERLANSMPIAGGNPFRSAGCSALASDEVKP